MESEKRLRNVIYRRHYRISAPDVLGAKLLVSCQSFEGKDLVGGEVQGVLKWGAAGALASERDWFRLFEGVCLLFAEMLISALLSY